jgi:AraC-like DNA-binding protein
LTIFIALLYCGTVGSALMVENGSPENVAWHRLSVCPSAPFGFYRGACHEDYGRKHFADFDLYVGVSGFATVRMLGQSIDLVAGSLILIPPGVKIHMRTDHREPSDMVFVHFDVLVDGEPIRLATSMVDEKQMSLTLPNCAPIALVGEYDDRDFGRELIDCAQRVADDTARLRSMVMFMDVLSRLRMTYTRAGAAPESAPIDLAVRFMRYHLADAILLPDICKAAGVSPSTLARLFETRLSTSPVRYLTHLRMSHARDLLRGAELNVGEVGFACGYKSPALFSRVFKVEHGMTPTEYRERHFGVP